MRDKIAAHQRFYLSDAPGDSDRVRFSAEESRHMVASLRLAAGDEVSATDGAGHVFRVVVEEATRRRVAGRIVARAEERAPEPRISLFQGIIRPARMDALVEQAGELGITQMVPVKCDRSLRGAGRERLARWRRIAVDAMKQSLRAHLMDVGPVEEFGGAVRFAAGSDMTLVASGPGDGPLPIDRIRERRPANLAVWVGPEGGFAEEEICALVEAGATPFSLGPYRLRSETAALTTIAVLRACLA